jgi:LysM repeat protein
MVRRVIQRFIPLFLGLTIITLLMLKPVQAQSGSATELINAVNQLRQSLGLAPYSVDSYLMGFAQSHSDYMASIGRWTHTRADGTTSFDYGIKENVAMGSTLSVPYVVNTIWSDWVHWQTMVGYTTGKVGAGVAIADGIAYYTLNVLPDSAQVSQPVPTSNTQGTTAQTTFNQAFTLPQIITSTPGTDGSIIHTVSSGETLWTISEAYEVPIDQILTHSGLSQGTTQLLVGQQLTIKPGLEPTITPTITDTPEPGTPTPTQPRPTMTPFPTRTPMPTATPTTEPSMLHRTLSDGRNIGLGLILASGCGLIALIYLGFIKKN